MKLLFACFRRVCSMRFVLTMALVWLALAASIVAFPRVQRGLTHLHWVPGLGSLYGGLDRPQEVWGIVGARNVYLRHTNGERFGIWHILPSGKLAVEAPSDSDPAQAAYFDAQLRSSCVVLYFHGNAFDRGAGHRLDLYRLVTASIGCHVVVPDWRGYADADGEPSESSQVDDAMLVWDWITNRVGSDQRVVVWGHSLGGGVANVFCEALLHRRGEKGLPSGLVLQSTFVSMRAAALAYPLGLPFTWVPGLREYFDSFWQDKYLAEAALKKTAATGVLPVLVVHGTADPDIGMWHGQALHDAAGNASRLVAIPNGGHRNLESTHAPSLARATQKWFANLETSSSESCSTTP